MTKTIKYFISIVFVTTLNFELETSGCFSQATRLWATYYGGSGFEFTYHSIATDAAGNIYLAGSTGSLSGIAAGGFQNAYGGGTLIGDAYLVKFDASGNRLWATYYGDTGSESGRSIAADIFGNVYLAGNTTSITGIASGGFQNTYGGGLLDAFLVKFDSNGNRLWAAYYGGEADDYCNNISTDYTGNVYLAGYTNSTIGIASGGFQNNLGGGNWDAFLVKFDATGTRLWATYFGGAGDEECYGLATEVSSGDVYITGTTSSTTGIALDGFQNFYGGGANDAFLVKFDTSGNRLWSTYYGGNGEEGYENSVVTDATGNVYLAGFTNSLSGISSGGFQNAYGGGGITDNKGDAFLVKFDAVGNRLWATYYGGANDEEVNNHSLATDTYGNVYLSGDTYSDNTGNCIAIGGFQNNLIGSTAPVENEFLAKFAADGNRLCATYYGQAHDENGKVAIDTSGNIYLAGYTQSASGIASGGFQNNLGGSYDNYLVKLSLCADLLTAGITSTDINCNSQCTGTGTVTPSGGITPYTYKWSTGQTTQTITGLCAGTYTVTITDASDVATAVVVNITEPFPLSNSVTPTNISCNGADNGSAITFVNGGTPGYTYLWSNGATTPQISNLTSQTYSITVTDANGCISEKAVIIIQPSSITASISATNNLCSNSDGKANALISGGTPPFSYHWSNGFTTSQISNLTSQIYSLTVTDANGCSISENISITSNSITTASISPDVTIHTGESTILNISNKVTYSWNPVTGLSCSTCQNPVANPVVTTLYYVITSDNNGCTSIDSITVFVIEDSLFIPNVFTPNGDGKNDRFKILANGYKNYRWQIFNRWGEKVFESNSSEIQWDGILQGSGKESADGTYYYILDLVDVKEKDKIYKGFFTLLR